MPAKQVKWIHCEQHGRVISPCVMCKMERYMQGVKEGKIKAYEAPEGDGPANDDPSPMQILLRSQKIKNEQLKSEEFLNNPFPLTPAEEAIQYIKETLSDHINIRFWEELRLGIEQELGRISNIPIVGMTPVQREAFLQEVIPMGKYAGRRVREVCKHDPDHLLKLSFRPTLFQMQLRRLLYTEIQDDE